MQSVEMMTTMHHLPTLLILSKQTVSNFSSFTPNAIFWLTPDRLLYLSCCRSLLCSVLVVRSVSSMLTSPAFLNSRHSCTCSTGNWLFCCRLNSSSIAGLLCWQGVPLPVHGFSSSSSCCALLSRELLRRVIVLQYLWTETIPHSIDADLPQLLLRRLVSATQEPLKWLHAETYQPWVVFAHLSLEVVLDCFTLQSARKKHCCDFGLGIFDVHNIRPFHA